MLNTGDYISVEQRALRHRDIASGHVLSCEARACKRSNVIGLCVASGAAVQSVSRHRGPDRDPAPRAFDTRPVDAS